MTVYTLFGQPASPSGSAGGGGATAGSYGVQFSVSSAARVDGLWFYSPAVAAGDALPASIAIYDTSGNLVVSANASWSGAAGSGWVFAAFPAPPRLVVGAGYKAVIYQTFITPNWNQTDATYWSSGAGSAGITSGILSAPGNASAANGQDSYASGTFFAYPNTSLAGANIWLDVQVSTPPANIYTAFQQQPVSAPATSDNNTYTFGMQFDVTQACTASAIWFYSPVGSLELPEEIALYDVASQTLIHSETPVWSGPVGSGWVRAPFASPPSLSTSTNYKACILKSGGSNFWYAAVSHYWDTGAGASGLTNGPISVPNNAGALNGQVGGGGQDVFNAGTGLIYPNNSFNAGNYWVDVEVTTSGGTAHNGTAALTGTGTMSGTGNKQVPGIAALAGSGTLSATGHKQVPGTAALSGTGTLSGTGSVSGDFQASVALAGTGTLSAAGHKQVPGAAAMSGTGVVRAAGTVTPPGGLVSGSAALSAAPVLTCSYLSARIEMSTNTLSLDNSLGTYGKPEPVSVIVVPGVIDGIYDGG